jgi:transmembrane sensor
MVERAARAGLAARVTAHQDQMMGEQRVLPTARAAWMRYAPPSRKPFGERWVQAGYVLAGAALAAVLLLVLQNRPLRLQTEGLASPGAGVGETLQAAHHEGMLRFSDGSLVILKSLSRARVASVTADGAHLVLEDGALHASIVHRKAASWSFQAGPFDVAVTGTQFDLQWAHESSSLTVRMHQGSVRVTGCSINPVALNAGQSVSVRCVASEPQMAAAAAPDATAPAAAASAAPIAVGTQTEQGSAALSSTAPAPSESASAREPTDAAAPDWKAWLAQGRFREAFAAAEGAGFEQECARAGARELLDLADAAAFAGRSDRATTALMAVRSRFGGSASSATAAYKLGRIAFDQRGALGDARNWFQVYLQEAPSGTLAREALGRLMEIDHRTGNTAAARARAEQYLRQYPQGPHAPLARSLAPP